MADDVASIPWICGDINEDISARSGFEPDADLQFAAVPAGYAGIHSFVPTLSRTFSHSRNIAHGTVRFHAYSVCYVRGGLY